jgi:hypothetical protein
VASVLRVSLWGRHQPKWRRVTLTALLATLALGGCGGSTEVVKTVTVERPTAAPTTPLEKPSKPRKERSSESAQAAPAPPATPSGYEQCDSNIEVKAETTTCAFAQNTFWHYWTYAGASQLQVYSPAASTSFEVACTVDSGRIACTTSDGGEVRFSQASVQLYDKRQADAYAGSHDLGPDPYESLASPDPPTSEPESLYNPGGNTGENIPNYENGNGYRVQCNDGMYSRSGGLQGACSGHGGVAP